MKRIPNAVYSKELREEAVKLVTESGLKVKEAGSRLSIAPYTLSYWLKANKAGTLGKVGQQQKPLTELEMELVRVTGVGRSKDGAGYIKKSHRILCQGVAARYAIMRKMRLTYPLPALCRVLAVSASGYYSWCKRPPSKWAREEDRLEAEILATHKRTCETFVPERLHHDLADHGIHMGICRIRWIRKKLGIIYKQKRKSK